MDTGHNKVFSTNMRRAYHFKSGIELLDRKFDYYHLRKLGCPSTYCSIAAFAKNGDIQIRLGKKCYGLNVCEHLPNSYVKAIIPIVMTL